MALQGRDQFHPPGTVFMHDYVGFCAQPVWPALGKKKCNYAIQVRRCFSKENAKHSFENALFIRCHFSRIPEVGLMSVARFSWVPNVYNLHFLLENHRPQPDPVNSYRDIIQVFML